MRATELLQREWIGSVITVHSSSNKSQEGLTGTIIDETKHTFLIATGRGRRRINKGNLHFRTQVEGRDVLIDASLLEKRPHDRIKAKKH